MTTPIIDYSAAQGLSVADAISHAALCGWVLNTHSDPTEEGRGGCSVEHAQAVASEDPSLVYLALACSTDEIDPNHRQESETREATIRRSAVEDVLVSFDDAGEIVAVLDERGNETTLTEEETRAVMDVPHGTILTSRHNRERER